MSCTENESGPFVVFFLPAVVGCLTILLARRWANSQVTSSSSTAVSRRRKIIKDPPIKRPLPPITCKMVPPGSKKATGLAKKSTFPIPEEEMNGGGKRMNRTSRTSQNNIGNGTEHKPPDGPLPPKHIPFPFIPHDGEILFEVMTFVFIIVATGLQFLNLYRTAWWLPNSYTNQAMHFHLIDPHLVAFIVTLSLRRLLLSLLLAILRAVWQPCPPPHVITAAKMFVLGVVIGAMAWCAYFIAMKNPLVRMFYLCYPALVYFLLFGFQSGPFLELNNPNTPMHSCSHDPHQIRAEVDALRQDFNLRVKKIIFNSVIGAYYSSFIPCCFAQPYLYYDVYSAAQQVAFVWGALFGRDAAQLASAQACDAPHRAARHLGRWETVTMTHTELANIPAWSGSRIWEAGALSRSPLAPSTGTATTTTATAYRVLSSAAAAAPGDSTHKRFHTVFIDPSSLLCMLLCMQFGLVVLQICLLFSSAPWHHFVSLVVLLFINYYTLFKLLRDYLVAWKVYKAENMIQDRNLTAQPSN